MKVLGTDRKRVGIQRAKGGAYLWTHMRQGDKRKEGVKVKQIWKEVNLKEVSLDGIFLL